MKRKITMIAAAVALVSSAYSAPITPEEALARANSSAPAKVRLMTGGGMRLVHTAHLENGVASAYIFSPTEGKGYTILSANSLAVPVIGYSDSGTIDVNNLPPSLKWWLDEQARKVEYVESKGFGVESVKAYAPEDMSAIPVLMKTKWDQSAPYDRETPEFNGVHAPTGCVATSFAQVMNYFKYPEKGEGSIRYVDSYGRSRTMKFNRNFQWDLMLDEYTGDYTDEQADAVAYLMKSCGYSVQMGYGRDASGAVSFRLANAATTYFKYDKGTYYTERQFYSLDQWTHMIYDNIKNVGPVIYDGRSIDGGHSFVCDGYDGNGYFHFNWGWGGLSDGYYVLDSLNPESQGIGGAEGGFNTSQGALLGMQPDKGGESHERYANVRIYGTTQAQLVGNNIEFTATGASMSGWGNASYRNIDVNVGAIFSKVGSEESVADVKGYLQFSYGENENLSLTETTFYPAYNVSPVVPIPQLADGDYKVTLASKDLQVADAPWQPMICDWGDTNYCYLSVSNGVAKVTTAAPSTLAVENSVIDSPLYMGRNARLVTSFKNNSDLQLTLCYSPVLFRSGKIQYEGDMMLASVDAGQTLEKTSLVAFYEAAGANDTGFGTYELKIVNRANNEVIGTFGEYELSSVSSRLKLTLDEFAVENAEQQAVQSGSRTFEDTYIISDPANFNLDVKYTVSQGYFDTSFRVIASRYNPETGKFEPFENNLYYVQPFLGQGESQDVVLPLDFSNYPGGYVYMLYASYIENGRNKTLGSISITYSNSGVEGVISDSVAAECEYYTLQGMKVENPVKGQVLIRKCGTTVSKIRY